MEFRPPILAGLLFSALAVVPAQRAMAQDNPDNQPHITPHETPTPTPARKSKQPQQKPSGQKASDQKSQDQSAPDQYERPPFPGDVAAPPPQPGVNQPSPKTYERPPFPGDAPGTNPTGESSSRDSQIDLNARPAMREPAPLEEDESVLKPWDPHKAAKDVEVGEYYLKIKNYRAALERFNHALVYKPNDAEATIGLAQTQEKLDLLDLADQNYRKYLEILPNGPRAKDAEEALKRIEPHVAMRNSASSRQDPATQAAHDMDVGETYLSANSFDAARERFEEALRLTPDNPLVYFRLAQSLQGMQRLDPARMYYRKYLELEPKGKYAKNAKKAIGEIDWILGK
jgi:Tfp pilus assembly protein PilF